MPAESVAARLNMHRPVSFRRADLIWTLVRTDFKTRYHGTVAGFFWALLKPLALVLVLMGVFSFIFGGRESYAAYLVTGLLIYNFFGDATKAGLMALFSKSFLLNKTIAPSWIIVVTSVSNALITLLTVWAVFLAILTVTGQGPGVMALGLMLVYFAHYLAMVIGISLALSVLFLVYRDLNEIWDVVTQAGFFLAPIIYPLDILPEHVHFWLYLWPPTPIIQFTREVLVDGTVPSLMAHVLLTVETGVILVLGVLIFRRYRTRIAEYV